jgi:hypothetical protein
MDSRSLVMRSVVSVILGAGVIEIGRHATTAVKRRVRPVVTNIVILLNIFSRLSGGMMLCSYTFNLVGLKLLNAACGHVNILPNTTETSHLKLPRVTLKQTGHLGHLERLKGMSKAFKSEMIYQWLLSLSEKERSEEKIFLVHDIPSFSYRNYSTCR